MTAHISDNICDIFAAFYIDDIISLTFDVLGGYIEFIYFGNDFLEVVGKAFMRNDKFKMIFLFRRGNVAAYKKSSTQEVFDTFVIINIGTVYSKIGLIF